MRFSVNSLGHGGRFAFPHWPAHAGDDFECAKSGPAVDKRMAEFVRQNRRDGEKLEQEQMEQPKPRNSRRGPHGNTPPLNSIISSKTHARVRSFL
jgi:hypothetical protein